MNYTYLLRCATEPCTAGGRTIWQRGWRHTMPERCKIHENPPSVVLAYYEEYATRSEAMRREAAIKKLTKKEKEAMQRWDGRSFRG